MAMFGSTTGVGTSTGRTWASAEQEKDEYAKEKAIMNELDEKGWSHIHHAASRGYNKSITRFVSASEDQLEFPTADDRHMTPLLLAVESGILDTVQCLVDLGSDLRYVNHYNQGVIEICCAHQYEKIVRYFIDLDHKDLPTWKLLLKIASSDTDEEAEGGAKMLSKLTARAEDKICPYWETFMNNSGVPTVVKIIKSAASDATKIHAFEVLLNIIDPKVIKEQAVKAGIIPAVLKLFKSNDKELLLNAVKLLCHIARVSDYVDLMVNNSAIPALVKICQTVSEPEILVQAVTTLGLIAEGNPAHKPTIGNTHGCFSVLVGLYEDCTSKPLLLALTHAVAQIVKNEQQNQTAFIDEGGASPMIMLASVKNRELQICAIEAIHMLAQDNPHSQKAILEEGGVMPLMQLLKRSRAPKVQVSTACALWALAGEDLEERRTMAGMIGISLLIEFLSEPEHDVLHYIGAEGLGVLAQGPLNKQDQISQSNGVQPLVRLLRSPKEHIVLSAIRALRYLCVGVGYVPHETNQNTLANSRGIRYLVPLMIYSKNELIQVEAALTLGSSALGNHDVVSQIMDNVDFNYVHILRLLYSKDDLVRLLAGSALAVFAYNNLQQQKNIAESGGVRYHCFVPFLESEDEFYRCNAAFQVVTLARIIPDEDQASSSAIGIKLLVDLLEDSTNEEIQALASDCIARLAHTRAGVPAAVVSINAINLLCNLMLKESEQVRGSAAIALGYLSFNHKAERLLLNECRKDPYLMKVLRYHTKKSKISPQFTEDWRHYRRIGLPPIDDRPSLVGKKADYWTQVKHPNAQHPFTIQSYGESGMSHQPSSPTNQLSTTYNEENPINEQTQVAVESPVLNNLSAHSPRVSRASGRISQALSSGHTTRRSIRSDGP